MSFFARRNRLVLTALGIDDLPVVETALQPFTTLLDEAPTGNPDGLDRINGLFVDGDRLIVNAERWYDAGGTAADTTLTVDVDDLDGGDVSGYFEMDGGVHAGGYMSPVPDVARHASPSTPTISSAGARCLIRPSSRLATWTSRSTPATTWLLTRSSRLRVALRHSGTSVRLDR